MFIQSFLFALLLFSATQADLSCLNPSGKAVDWFVALKYPKGIDPDGKNKIKENL
jgi:hypothetical protein